MRFALKVAGCAAPLLLTVGLASCAPTPGGAGGGPTTTVPPTGAVQVAAGAEHTCALLACGTVSCWGDNQYGELGNETNRGTQNPNPTPSAVVDLTGVTQIAAGDFHTCALLTGGTVSCWGYNEYGQAGNPINTGIDEGNSTPTVVSDGVVQLTGVTQIAAGDDHSCALLTNGNVKCWGLNFFGELGIASGYSTIPFVANPGPTGVAGVSGATQIAAGVESTCVLLGTGTVKCWGYDGNGQLGSGGGGPTPTAVAGLSGVSKIAIGEDHMCALLTGGTVTCLGNNNHGQLGNATNNGMDSVSSTPTAVEGVSGVTQISAGLGSTCALLTDGTASCWGDNSSGQMGNSTNSGTQNPDPPMVVPGVTGVGQISAGSGHTCARLTDHTVDCWGHNDDGQIGRPANGGANSDPEAVPGIP